MSRNIIHEPRSLSVTSDHRASPGRNGNLSQRGFALAVFWLSLIWLVGFWSAGCSRPSYIVHQPPVELITVNYTVADTLIEALCKPETCEMPLLMSSFVMLDNLDRTSPLGRIIPQQIGSRFAQHGLHMVDVRLRTQSLLIRKGQGEFALSRELDKINRDVNAFAVLTGTYSVVYGRVYVTAMILRSTDGALLASLDYYLPVDRRSLRTGTLEGIPLTLPEELPDPFDGTIQPSVITRLSPQRIL
ncbi:FlgO family outer membrane protein [Desulfonatronum parangueonense]